MPELFEAKSSEILLNRPEEAPRSNSSLKIFSLNIEGSKHLDEILTFIDREKPDAVLMQEVFERDLPRFRNALNAPAYFSPQCRLSLSGNASDLDNWGIAILTRHPVIEYSEDYYKGSPEVAARPNLDNHAADARSLLQVLVRAKKKLLNFGTIHSTWTRGKEVSDEQRTDLGTMLTVIDRSRLVQHHGLVLAGDLNSPRGYEIYDTLATRFKDNIPSDVVTTLDPTPERPAPWDVVIDCLNTTPHYDAHDVRIVGGLSDHKGIVAQIQRVA
jgi:hypothetical protein